MLILLHATYYFTLLNTTWDDFLKTVSLNKFLNIFPYVLHPADLNMLHNKLTLMDVYLLCKALSLLREAQILILNF